MGRLAVVGGHSILGSAWGTDAARREVAVGNATVVVFDDDLRVVLHRHGIDDYTPAHRVDHVANLRALGEVGCDRVLAVSSVGSLRAEWGVGTFVAPDDFIALDTTIAVYHDVQSHLVPAFDREWRARVVRVANDAGARTLDGGVYWQTTGPRFETRAEIRFMARFADLVGMTAASEAIVAQELGLQYAVVCVVDNLANGIAEEPLSTEEFEAGKRATRASVLAFLDAIVPILA
ncbi:MAG: MTAP family purine nucleoside phosphorylase [Acidimicrobiia bacterium]